MMIVVRSRSILAVPAISLRLESICGPESRTVLMVAVISSVVICVRKLKVIVGRVKDLSGTMDIVGADQGLFCALLPVCHNTSV